MNINGVISKSIQNAGSVSVNGLPAGVYIIRVRMHNNGPADVFKYVL